MPSSTGRSPYRRGSRNTFLGTDTSSTSVNPNVNSVAITNTNSHTNHPPSATANTNANNSNNTSSIFSPDFNDPNSPHFSPNFSQSRLSFGSTAAADAWAHPTHAHSPGISTAGGGGMGIHEHDSASFGRIAGRKKLAAARHSISNRLRNSTGGVLVNGIPSAEDPNITTVGDVNDINTTDNESTNNNESNFALSATASTSGAQQNHDMLDPNTKLRKLVSSCLHCTSGVTTTSPTSAAFYASILYTKTEAPRDAYLFATALMANQEKRRAAFILEKAGLLSLETLVYDAEEYVSEKEYMRLIIEAMLLASQCFASFGEWDEVSTLLEEVVKYDFEIPLEEMKRSKYLNNFDGDDVNEEGLEGEISLLRLSHFLDSTVEYGNIHPMARLCLMRGKACDEASNPSRAASFLKLALQIDIKCIEAWTYLCQRRLMTSEEEIELVMSLRFDEPDLDWLRDIFFARLSIGGANSAPERQSVSLPFASPISASTPMHILPEHPTPQIDMTVDASAIQLQGTPSTPFNFLSGDAANGKNQSNITKEMKQQVEDSFQNLHFKHNLSHSPDVLALAATRAYNAYNLSLALHYCQVLYEMDPLSTDAAGIQIATLTALGQKRPLFRLSHALVDADSKSATAWYAVGCYYYACGRYDLAQQHFWRSTRLDRRNANGWVAFGCAFAACDENDQANACFRTAQRLHSGSHYPMLYMGMEHLRTNNIPLAGHFLKSARSMEKHDPLCCNELGVWAYRSKDWNVAIKWFLLALRLYVEADVSEKASLAWNSDKSESKVSKPRFEFGQRQGQDGSALFSDTDCVEFCQDAFWEPTIFNLGQSYRKLKKFQEATSCFHKCLALCPEKAMSFSALAFTRHLAGDLDGAIEAYHQALSRKPDDPFASEMLNRAMMESLDLGPMIIPDVGGVSLSMSMSMGFKQSFSQSVDEAFDESAFSLGDSDVDMSMA
jgi:anaphase-promoting complex subunit 6